jgi:hypothetical protein
MFSDPQFESQRRAKLIFVQCYVNCERRVQTPLGFPRNERVRLESSEPFSFSLGPLSLYPYSISIDLERPVPRWDDVRNVVDESPANVFYDKESRDVKV